MTAFDVAGKQTTSPVVLDARDEKMATINFMQPALNFKQPHRLGDLWRSSEKCHATVILRRAFLQCRSALCRVRRSRRQGTAARLFAGAPTREERHARRRRRGSSRARSCSCARSPPPCALSEGNDTTRTRPLTASKLPGDNCASGCCCSLGSLSAVPSVSPSPVSRSCETKRCNAYPVS